MVCINIALLNYADYTDERKLRQLISSYNALYALAQKGDTVAASIFVDLKNALYTEGVLSVSQRECIEMCVIDGTTQDDAAKILGVSRETVKTHVKRGMTKIYDFLTPCVT